MNAFSPFLVIDQPCDKALHWINQRLARNDLRAMQTFDLHGARLGLDDCPCPHHGTAQCDCQMVVLLIYGEKAEPATLIIHGNNGRTWLSLVNTSAQHADSSLQASIEKALQIHFKEGL